VVFRHNLPGASTGRLRLSTLLGRKRFHFGGLGQRCTQPFMVSPRAFA
jgi:hypothetical protein